MDNSNYLNPYIYRVISDHGLNKPDIDVAIQPSYTQAYEDVIIEAYIHAYLASTFRHLNLIFFEIGANHPVATSASYLLKQRFGLHTVLVEANPELIPALKQHRPDDTVIHAAVTHQDVKELPFYLSTDNEISSMNKEFVEAWKDGAIKDTIMVPTVRINDIFDAMKLPENVDIILSIDVEGCDYDILKDIDFQRYKPFIIMVEPSEEFAPGITKQMMDLLIGQGYILYAKTFVNLIFTLRE